MFMHFFFNVTFGVIFIIIIVVYYSNFYLFGIGT